MKKGLVFIAALLIAVSSSFGQAQKGRINISELKRKMEKSDQDIQDPKKNQKGLTWLERGDAYLDAAQAPTKGLGRGLKLDQVREMDVSLEQPTQLPSLARGADTYEVYEFERFILYFINGNLAMWTENKVILDPEAFEKSAQAYSTAYILDGSSMKKAADGLRKIVNEVKNRASTYLGLQQYDKAAQEYLRSYNIQQIRPIEKIDTLDLYYAGMSYVVGEDYDKALEPLQKLMEMGYMKDGDVPYYLFHAYLGKDQKEEARKVLIDGLKQFPDLQKLLDPLPAMYVSLPDADINEMLPYAEKVLEKDPENITFLFGLAQAYAVRNQSDKAFPYYKIASDVDPSDYRYAFNTGIIILQQTEAKMSKLKDLQDSMSYEDVKEQAESIVDIYEEALPYLLRAEAARPDDMAPVELIRNVTLRLRERSPEYQAMYDKYTEKYKALGGTVLEEE